MRVLLRASSVLMALNTTEPDHMNKAESHAGLRSILDVLTESRNCYMDLCNRAQDSSTKDFLIALSWDRIALESALMGEVRRAGIQLQGSNDTGMNELSNGWEEVREALSNANGRHVLAACERGEGYLLKRYDEALQQDGLDDATRSVLVQQRAQVKHNVNSVRSRTKPAVPAAR